MEDELMDIWGLRRRGKKEGGSNRRNNWGCGATWSCALLGICPKSALFPEAAGFSGQNLRFICIYQLFHLLETLVAVQSLAGNLWAMRIPVSSRKQMPLLTGTVGSWDKISWTGNHYQGWPKKATMQMCKKRSFLVGYRKKGDSCPNMAAAKICSCRPHVTTFIFPNY